MAQYKALILASLVITTLNSCEAQAKRELNDERTIKQMEFEKDTIIIISSQYEIIKRINGVLDIKLTDNELLYELKSQLNPIIIIELDGCYYTAKGNNILSSSIPENCDYFYPLDKDGQVILYKGLIINLRKI